MTDDVRREVLRSSVPRAPSRDDDFWPKRFAAAARAKAAGTYPPPPRRNPIILDPNSFIPSAEKLKEFLQLDQTPEVIVASLAERGRDIIPEDDPTAEKFQICDIDDRQMSQLEELMNFPVDGESPLIWFHGKKRLAYTGQPKQKETDASGQ